MVNMAKIDEVMAKIEKEYAKGQSGEFCAWNQSAWAKKFPCGTAYCFAGWRVVLDGGVPLLNSDTGYDTTDFAVLPNGKKVIIDLYAKDALGLTERDAEKLFYGGNDIEALRAVVKWLRKYGSIDEY